MEDKNLRLRARLRIRSRDRFFHQRFTSVNISDFLERVLHFLLVTFSSRDDWQIGTGN